jgi:RES domain-containing protein
MRLWRVASMRRAADFTGGYGLVYPGRWNTPSRPVTYCSTVPSLAVLEKRVHATDASLLPPQAIVEYDVPDDMTRRVIDLESLPVDWVKHQVDTQHWRSLARRNDRSVARPIGNRASCECSRPQCPGQSSVRRHRTHHGFGRHSIQLGPAPFTP